MDTLEGFESRTVVCATAWLGSRNFGNLVDCFTGMGFTQGCSTLWAHYTLLNALLCAAVCLPDSSTNLVKLIEGPDCAYTNCVKCAAEDYPLNEILDDLSGHTVLGGAIVDRKPLPCSEYTPLVYDPCGGTPYVPEDNQGNNQDNNQGNQGGDDSGVMNAALSRFVIALVGVVAFAIF